VFEDAYYHAMNRGCARQKVFHDKLYFEAFLKTLEDRDIGGYKLSQIASHFGLKRIGSISNTIAKLKFCMERDRKLVDKASRLSDKYVLTRITLSEKERKYGDPAIKHHEVFSAVPNVLLAMLHYASGRCSSPYSDRFDFALASQWALTTGFNVRRIIIATTCMAT